MIYKIDRIDTFDIKSNMSNEYYGKLFNRRGTRTISVQNVQNWTLNPLDCQTSRVNLDKNPNE